jgi:autotransporter-associated beta strand protein
MAPGTLPAPEFFNSTARSSRPVATSPRRGTGTLLLNGGPGSSYNSTFVNAGVLQINNADVGSSFVTVVGGATFDLGTGSPIFTNSLNLNGNGVNGTAGANTWSGPLTLQGDTSVLVAFGSELTLPSPITETTRAALIKIDEGTLILTANNDHTGGTVIEEGTLSINGELPLGSGPVTINAGKLLYTASASTSRNFTLVNGGLQAGVGANLTLNSSRVNGGFLMGPGAFLTNASTVLSGVTAFAGTNIEVNGSTRFNAFINGGNLTSSSTVSWDGGINLSSGVLTLQSGALTTTGITNDGVININNTATLANSGNPLVSGGGSRITINPGAMLNVSGNSLDLNGALLINNGTITGPTNVNYGSLAKGAGIYGEVNVTDGGRFSPGNSPGAVTTGSATWNFGGIFSVEIVDALAGPGLGWDLWNIDGELVINALSHSTGRFSITLSSLAGEASGPAANFNSNHDYHWLILSAANDLQPHLDRLSLDASNFTNLHSGSFTLSSSSDGLYINYTAVPEPIAAGLFACLISLGFRRVSRRFSAGLT